MANKLFRDLSANTVQTGITQVAGLLIFYLLSRFIPKEQFGDFQWTGAIAATAITVGSLGLDMVLVKRIAAGQKPVRMAGVHLFHTLIVSSVVLAGAIITQYFLPAFVQLHPVFLLIIVQQAVSNVANSFKFSLTGFESFKPLAAISLLLNISKMIIVAGLFFLGYLSIRNVAFGFLIASALELAAGFYFLRRKLRGRIKPLYAPKTYKGFVMESLPQLGVVLFDSALARIDWILLGIFSTAAVTAEYTFAYKFFELSKLPLLILGPVLLTRLSALLSAKNPISTEQKARINDFVRLELALSFLIPIVMTCVWSELIDRLTDGKFGAVNHTTFLILSLCVPLHFAINFLWTLAFVQGRLKSIMYITIFSSLLNLGANAVLIPKLAGAGAALSFLLSTVVQFFAYYFHTDKSQLRLPLNSLLLLFGGACASVLLTRMFISNPYLSAVLATICFLGIVAALRIADPRHVLRKGIKD
jgi:O-antigen/teichoic acid export membrane protein